MYNFEIEIDFLRIADTSICPPRRVPFFEEELHFGKWENNRCRSTNEEFHSMLNSWESFAGEYFCIYIYIRFGSFSQSAVWRMTNTLAPWQADRGEEKARDCREVSEAMSGLISSSRLRVPLTLNDWLFPVPPRREESRLIRPFTLQAFLLLSNYPTATLSKRSQLLPSFRNSFRERIRYRTISPLS